MDLKENKIYFIYPQGLTHSLHQTHSETHCSVLQPIPVSNALALVVGRRHFLSSRILINVFIYKARVCVYVHPCVLLTIPEHAHQPEVEQERPDGGQNQESRVEEAAR